MKCVNYRRNYNKLLILSTFCFISLSLCDNLSSSTIAGAKPPAISEQKPNVTNLNNNNSNNKNNNNTNHNNQNSIVNLSESQKSDSDKNKKNNTTSDVNKQNDQSKNQTSSDDTEGLKGHNTPSLNSGAVKRAFYVFVGLSVLSVAYLLFRSTRLRQSPAQMVRKYGVLAHKQDIEMRPLPLDEDDEDDTVVFDASGYSKSTQPASKAF